MFCWGKGDKIIMNDTVRAMELANKYYDEDTFYHALRVACYAIENPIVKEENKELVFIIGILHDILEDTDYTYSVLDFVNNQNLEPYLELISKKDDEEYIDYIRRIKVGAVQRPEAWIVKLADMRDHLSLTETLTDKLRDKYIEALPYLI